MSHGQASFSEMWHRHDDFASDEPEPDLCQPAAELAEWVENLIREVNERSTEAAVHVGKLLLQDRYWAFYNTASKVHKNHIGTRAGHTCIFQVYQAAYNTLHTLELSLTPPRLADPQVPSAARPSGLANRLSSPVWR